jgi:predicted ATPase
MAWLCPAFNPTPPLVPLLHDTPMLAPSLLLSMATTPQALAYGRECAHPFSLAYAQIGLTCVLLYRQEKHDVQQWAETTIALAREHGFLYWETLGTIMLGWALTKQRHREEGIEQLRQVVNAWRAMGIGNSRPFPAWLVEAYGDVGQPEEGLTVLAEGLAQVEKTGEHIDEAELYRVKGTLTLESKVESHTSKVAEAEECFLKAIEIAQKQQAKSLELRAVMSLARLWQSQGKRADAHKVLSEIYSWFTEGFDTKDLQEAKELLEKLAEG